MASPGLAFDRPLYTPVKPTLPDPSVPDGWKRLRLPRRHTCRSLAGGHRSDSDPNDFRAGATLALRIDTEMKIISGDLFEDPELRRFRYAFRSEAITYRVVDGKINVICVADVMPGQGREFDSPTKVRVELSGDQYKIDAVRMFPYSGAIPTLGYEFEAVEAFDNYRSVDLKIKSETSIQIPRIFLGGGVEQQSAEPTAVEQLFGNAGVRMTTHLLPESISRRATGWTREELHAALIEEDEAEQRAWRAWLLFATEAAVEPGKNPPLGLMFDSTDSFPRQGAVVFLKTLNQRYAQQPDQIDRMTLFTTMHELGHVFNLLHSFQVDWGVPGALHARPGALSWMNYPKYYPFGEVFPPDWDGRARFWERFEKINSFDPEEIIHLRHGAHDQVVMGGRWAGHKPAEGEFLPPTDQDQVEVILDIRNGLCQGVVTLQQLEQLDGSVRICNKTGDKVVLPKGCDPESSSVDLLIRPPDARHPRIFRSLIARCVEPDTVECVKGESVEAPLPLSFGLDGWYFDSPGSYLVQAICRLPDGRQIASRRIRIDVKPVGGAPRIEKWLRSDRAGYFMTVDGSRARTFEQVRENIDKARKDRSDLRITQQLSRIEEWMSIRPFRIGKGNQSAGRQDCGKLLHTMLRESETKTGLPYPRTPLRTARILLDCAAGGRIAQKSKEREKWHATCRSTGQKILGSQGGSAHLLQWYSKLLNEAMQAPLA